MSETAAEASTDGTGGVESRRIHLQFLARFSGRRNREGLHRSGGFEARRWRFRRKIGAENLVEWNGRRGVEEIRDERRRELSFRDGHGRIWRARGKRENEFDLINKLVIKLNWYLYLFEKKSKFLNDIVAKKMVFL